MLPVVPKKGVSRPSWGGGGDVLTFNLQKQYHFSCSIYRRCFKVTSFYCDVCESVGVRGERCESVCGVGGGAGGKSLKKYLRRQWPYRFPNHVVYLR